MSMARRPSPFGELLSLRQAMDRLFEDSYVRSRGEPYGNVEAMALPLDIYSTPEAIVVEAALPGVKPEDVEIVVLGNTLTITGTSHGQQVSQDADFMYQELRRGTFSRTVALPSNVGTHQSTATFDNGMLRLSIPKAPEARPRQIRITPTSPDAAGDQDAGPAGGAGAPSVTGGPEATRAPGADGASDEGAQSAHWQPAATGNDDWQGGGTTGEWQAPEPAADAEAGSADPVNATAGSDKDRAGTAGGEAADAAEGARG